MNNSDLNNAETFAPDRQLMFALVNAGKAVEQRLEEALAPIGLTMTKFGMLMYLVQAGEPLTFSECAQKMSCVRSNITQLMDRLEADGLVRRVLDPNDRRATRAEVTPLGAEKHAAGEVVVTRVQTEIAESLAKMDPERVRRALLAVQ